MKIKDTLLSMLTIIKQTIIIRSKIIISLYSIVLLIPSLASATDYYVLPSGSDTNAGSLYSPFKTISKGISRLTAGDILYVRTGTYAESVYINTRSGTETSPIVIMAYPGESPVVDGGNTKPGSMNSGLLEIQEDYIYISGLEIKNSAGQGIILVGEHNKISNMNVHNCQGNGVSAVGNYSIVEDSQVWNCTLGNSTNPGEVLSWGAGLTACRGYGITNNAILRRNIVHDNWGEGLSTYEAIGTIIEDNIIYDNWSVNLYISNAQDVLCQRNLVYKTKHLLNERDVGILLNDENEVLLGKNITIINNIVYGNLRNLYLNMYTNILIANNTFVNSADIACMQITGDYFTNVIITNNIIVQEDNLPVIYPYFYGDKNLKFNHNLWNKTPDSDASGTGDIIGNPQLAKTGTTGAGELTADYFRLLNTSPAINKGTIVNIVTDDIFGNPRDATPDIGAHEYTILNQKIAVTGIIITGPGGATIITTDNGTLQLSASVLPSNATNQTVTWSISNGTGQASISTSGLVTAITNGTATASATANDGSGVIGKLVITISNQVVPANPVYISSSIENATPSRLEMNYNLSLANVLPAVSAFTVLVNSVARTVNAVAVSGTKVLLTLISPVVYGDVVTITYTRPATNPLQTASGEQAATISAQSVTNTVNFVNTPPVVVVNYSSSSYSGFVYEINASGSYDANNDNLSYTWIVPDNIPVSTTNSSKTQFLSPVVNAPQTVEFTLKISDGKTTQSKTVPVEILPYKPELEVAEVLKVEASGFQSPNYPHNVLDGNIGTLWAADGDNQWLIMELKELFSIHHVKLAFQLGQRRESYFDLLGSQDKVSWEPILTKSSSCAFSGDLQVFDFPPSKAGKEFKYVKLVGQSNSVDSWNTISEFRIFGYKHRNPSSYEEQPVKIYPNPAQRLINIKIDEATLKPDFIRIINLSGKVVRQDKMNPDIKEFQIPINLLNGVYIVQIGSGYLTLFTQKLIVNN